MDNNFSVLISVYIKEKAEYLDRVLKSAIQEQFLILKELLIVEEGPLTKELYEVIYHYKNRNSTIIKTVALKENKGLGEALNIGLKAKSFEVVTRMDSDYIMLPHRFIKRCNFSMNNNYDVVGTNIIEFEKDENNIIGLKKVPENHQDILKYSKLRSSINHMTVMFKKKAVLESGNYEKTPFFVDYYLWIKMLKKGYMFYNILEPLIKVRAGKEMIKRRWRFEYFKNEKYFFLELFRIGYINYFEYLQAIGIRFFFRILLDNLRLFFYNKMLRSKE